MNDGVEVPARRRRSDQSLIRATDNQVPEGSKVVRPQPEYRNWNVRLPADLVERIYGACAELAEEEDIRSNVGFTVRAMEELLDRLEKKHNGGEPYRQVDSPFRPGRPVSYRR